MLFFLYMFYASQMFSNLQLETLYQILTLPKDGEKRWN